MPNYQLSKVYQIVCLTTGQKYVGSTTQKTLAERLAGHNSHFKCWKKGTYHFVSSFTILEHGNYQIELLEAYPCGSKDELNAREGHYIQTIKCVNKCVMGRTVKEWREDHKIEKAEYDKEYREDHKIELAEQKKEYSEKNKVKIAEYKKQYSEINKVKIAEHKKEYSEKNKVKIAEYKKRWYEAKKTLVVI
jgi:hypothetical protein